MRPGVDLVADLFTALEEDPVPVACGGGARARCGGVPPDWRDLAATGSGLPRSDTSLAPTSEPAPQLIGRLARDVDGLVVVALGPMTNLADLSVEDPQEYARLDGIHAMGGSVEGPLVDGVAEWNVAADPDAFATVLASGASLTVVPEDAIPDGTPAALVRAGRRRTSPPRWTTPGGGTSPPRRRSSRAGGGRRGRLGARRRRTRSPGAHGDGPIRVVRSLDTAALEREYGVAFAVD